jgi:hypothetical protein
MLFADDAALVAHTEAALEQKSNIIAQDITTSPTIIIGDPTMEVVDKFITFVPQPLPGCRAQREDRQSSNRLAKRVWDNPMLTLNTKMKV